MRFVRVLYGNISSQARLVLDIQRSLRTGHQGNFPLDDVYYYTLGSEATDFLVDNGAVNVIQVDSQPTLRESGGCNSWHKLYLLREAVRKHGEVIYLDFDIYIDPVFRVWQFCQRLRKRHNSYGIQIPSIHYRRPRFFWRKTIGDGGWNTISPRKGFCGCFMFLTRLSLIDTFLADYEELVETVVHSAGDEQTITYSLDKRYGPLTVRQMYRRFEPEVIWNKRSPLVQLGVHKRYPVLWHM